MGIPVRDYLGGFSGESPEGLLRRIATNIEDGQVEVTSVEVKAYDEKDTAYLLVWVKGAGE